MSGVLVLSILTGQAAVTPKVDYVGGKFVVSGSGKSAEVNPASIGPTGSASAKSLKLKVGLHTVVFDQRGLGIGKEKALAFSTLKQLPLSRKIFSEAEIAETSRLNKAGKRKLETAGLSGWHLQGDQLFMLVRWADGNKPWAEALVVVDCAQAAPQTKFVARFEGLSFAKGVVDDRLVVRNGRLWVLGNSPDRFGLGSVGLDGKNPGFRPLAEKVGNAAFSEDARWGFTTLPTPYKTTLIGLVDVEAVSFRQTAEVRGEVAGFYHPGFARCKDSSRSSLLNLLTGAEITVIPDSLQAQTPFGLLLWAPRTNPTKAVLFDQQFRRLATWAKSQAPAAPPKP